MKYMFILLAFLGVSGSASCQDQDLLPASTKIQTSDLHPAIAEKYNNRQFQTCSPPKKCGDIVMVDCNSSTDGPLTYYNNTNGEVLMYCGGVCLMAQKDTDPKKCQACPPPEWTCKQ